MSKQANNPIIARLLCLESRQILKHYERIGTCPEEAHLDRTGKKGDSYASLGFI